MKRKIRSLSEQMSEARSAYNRVLGRTNVFNKTILNEQSSSATTATTGTLGIAITYKTCNNSTVIGGGRKITINENGVLRSPVIGDFFCFGEGNPTNPWVLQHGCIMEVVGFHWNTSSTLTGTVDFLPDGCNSTNCCAGPGCTSCGTTTSPCDMSTGSPCAVQWWQNPNATWASNWINNRDCSNYTWPALNLEQQALDIMNDTSNYGTNTPNPQTGPFNGFQDIWDAANNSGLIAPHKGQFIGKMAKSKFSQCQKQACNC